MPQDNDRGRNPERRSDIERGPTPMTRGRPVERDPAGHDPSLVAARWTLQGGEPEPQADED